MTISPARQCAVCGRWKPKGGRWLTPADPTQRGAPVVCAMRCAPGWPGPVPPPPVGRKVR
jgi:hypothetical protein